ncbi:hypothetical protein ABIA33_003442 [Streptacidiphilus sp. MAP12-16]|uniref:hypothetical protein n=1 Tax=Streptacidiphilus sp. MAP12-16 TaxID=3156300 RepID=UPI003519769C
MSEAGMVGRGPKQLAELRDVFGFLDEVRLRPGMWIRASSLQHLDSVLSGYRVALEVHGIEEEFDFWNLGPFTEWLWQRLGRSSSLGWAAEIEREAVDTETSPVELFFAFLDEYRVHRAMSQDR